MANGLVNRQRKNSAEGIDYALKDRVRSLRDVCLFCVTTLRPPNIPLTVVFFLLFVAALALWIRNILFGAWIPVAIGSAILTKNVACFGVRWFSSPRTKLEQDHEMPKFLSALRLASDYVEAGYTKVAVPNRDAEYVVRSMSIDIILRERDLQIEECQEFQQRLRRKLRKQPELEEMLRSKYDDSWRRQKHFFNESKACLASDLLQPDQILHIYKGSYFGSFLTNELVAYLLESTGPRPVIRYRGSDHFPADNNVLKSISNSAVGNHIGISTVVHTSDGYLVTWRQSKAAQQSQRLMAPTGSGSCDWSDWKRLDGPKSLKRLLAAAMEREFREESHPLKAGLDDATITTEVLGFFRWLKRAGKPEFVGLSKVDVPSFELEPNATEVDAPEYILNTYCASSISRFRESLEGTEDRPGLLQSDSLSVPLWVNLICLDEALRAEPQKWAQLLKISL